ncbi:DUF1707 domain-containing protein [Plantactinospora sp. GCM10030261]|uniref:DUF1707 SHOCT-like domain-containing protein n=1 Tax=Plantactinospora sp. GCM10030261 TaxID=3273420 RepID=UPI003607A184
MDQRGHMRASDADREAVADRLRGALSEGRLDLPEYDERLRRAYAAKTYDDLSGLLTDLPETAPPERSGLAPTPPQPASPVPDAGSAAPGGPGARSGRSAVTRGWLLATWSSYLSVVAITVAIWLVTSLMSGEWQYFWPVWVAGPWGAVILVTTITGLLSGAPHRWHGHGRWHERNRRR